MEIKELCIFKKRFIKKKCFSAWKNSVLGKITDFTVRNHYHSMLLKKCILKWEKTLFSRREWKLNIRADYYYRFRMYQMTFKAWSTYVMMSKKKKKATSTAYLFVQKRLLQLSFKKWTCYIKIISIYCVKKNEAVLRFNLILVRKHWYVWWNCYRNKFIQNYTALHHWADHVLAKSYFFWKDVYYKNCLIMERFKVFTSHQNKKTVARNLKKWKNYSAVQHERNRLCDNAQMLYAHNLMKSSLKNWFVSYTHLQSLKRKELLIEIICKNFTKQRYFLLLKSNTLSKKRRCKSIQLYCQQFCQQKIKKKILFAFKRNVIKNKVIKDNKSHSSYFYVTQLMRSSLKRWISEYDRKNEEKQYSLSQISINYYRSRSLSMSFFFWMRFIKSQNKKQKKFQLAVFHYNKHLISKLFINWFSFKSDCTTFKKMDKEAAQFCRSLTYSKVFYAWLRDYRINTHQDALHEIAHQYYSLHMAKYFFKAWKQKLKKKILLISFKKQADQHYILRTKSFFYQQWKCKKRNTHNALSYFECYIKRKFWMALQKNCSYCKQKTNNKRRAGLFYEKKQKYTIFRRWKKYTVCELLIFQEANHRFLTKAALLNSWVIFSWKEFYRISKHDIFKLDLANRHYANQISKKIFHLLRFFSLKCNQQRFLEEESLIRARLRLDRGTIKNVFQKWKDLLIESKYLSGKTHISKKHYKRNLQFKVFRNLKTFKQFSQKMKLINRISSRFFMLCVWKRFYNIWLCKHHNYLVNNKSKSILCWHDGTLSWQSNIVVLWWSIRLQKKVFVSWKRWVFSGQERNSTYDEINCKLLKKNQVAYDRVNQHHLVKNISQRNILKAFENGHGYTKKEFFKLEEYRPFGYVTSASKLRFNRPTPRIPDCLRESFDLNLGYGLQSTHGSGN